MPGELRWYRERSTLSSSRRMEGVFYWSRSAAVGRNAQRVGATSEQTRGTRRIQEGAMAMSLSKRYDPNTIEPALRDLWQREGTYHFQREDARPIYSIDTPPPTVSGNLHLGHTYSYSHTDFMARFWRMNGYSVFYPMGYDDNGLPTERLVEKRLGITPPQVGRGAFIEKRLAVSGEAGKDYQSLWQGLGLSVAAR